MVPTLAFRTSNLGNRIKPSKNKKNACSIQECAFPILPISVFEKNIVKQIKNEGDHCSDAFPIADTWWEHINCTTIGQKYRGLADMEYKKALP